MQLSVIEHQGSTSLPPIVFIHGACLGAWSWGDNFLPYFNGLGYHTVAINLRGHGEKTRWGLLKNASINDYVSDVESIISKLENPPVVVGHSMGGLIAQKVVQKNRASGLVLIASSPTEGMKKYGLSLFKKFPWAFIKATITKDILKIYPDDKHVRHIMFSPSTPKSIVSDCRERLQPESWNASQEMNAPTPELRDASCPVLVLGGECDNTVPVQGIENTSKAYSAECKIFSNMGHNLMLEESWEQVANYMNEWLNKTINLTKSSSGRAKSARR